MGLLGCLLALSVASAYASGGRLTLPGSALAASQNTAAAPAEAVVHNNNRPLIGVLAQACHRCPGRCAPRPVWFRKEQHLPATVQQSYQCET